MNLFFESIETFFQDSQTFLLILTYLFLTSKKLYQSIGLNHALHYFDFIYYQVVKECYLVSCYGIFAHWAEVFLCKMFANAVEMVAVSAGQGTDSSVHDLKTNGAARQFKSIIVVNLIMFRLGRYCLLSPKDCKRIAHQILISVKLINERMLISLVIKEFSITYTFCSYFIAYINSSTLLSQINLNQESVNFIGLLSQPFPCLHPQSGQQFIVCLPSWSYLPVSCQQKLFHHFYFTQKNINRDSYEESQLNFVYLYFSTFQDIQLGSHRKPKILFGVSDVLTTEP